MPIRRLRTESWRGRTPTGSIASIRAATPEASMIASRRARLRKGSRYPPQHHLLLGHRGQLSRDVTLPLLHLIQAAHDAGDSRPAGGNRGDAATVQASPVGTERTKSASVMLRRPGLRPPQIRPCPAKVAAAMSGSAKRARTGTVRALAPPASRASRREPRRCRRHGSGEAPRRRSLRPRPGRSAPGSASWPPPLTGRRQGAGSPRSPPRCKAPSHALWAAAPTAAQGERQAHGKAHAGWLSACARWRARVRTCRGRQTARSPPHTAAPARQALTPPAQRTPLGERPRTAAPWPAPPPPARRQPPHRARRPPPPR